VGGCGMWKALRLYVRKNQNDSRSNVNNSNPVIRARARPQPGPLRRAVGDAAGGFISGRAARRSSRQPIRRQDRIEPYGRFRHQLIIDIDHGDKLREIHCSADRLNAL
jgi:hypothetical protein